MKAPKLTKIFLGSLVALVIVYDILILIIGGSKATVSYQVWLLGKKFMFLPYSVGVLVSHFFGPDSFIKKIPTARYFIWIPISVLCLVMSIVFYPIPIHPYVAMSLGLMIGMFWAQEEIHEER